MILKVNQLANQIDNLRLADNNDDDSPMDADSDELSSSISEWRVNLQKSWQNFMDSFITVRRRDETAVPLLAPNQDIYLRENIRSRLLVAAQAVPRHQEETWKQSLDNVSTWVRAYYDTDDATTKAFLDEVDKLSQQSITMTVPETLQSRGVAGKTDADPSAQPDGAACRYRGRRAFARTCCAGRPRCAARRVTHAENSFTLRTVDRRDRAWPDDRRASGLRPDPDR